MGFVFWTRERERRCLQLKRNEITFIKASHEVIKLRRNILIAVLATSIPHSGEFWYTLMGQISGNAYSLDTHPTVNDVRPTWPDAPTRFQEHASRSFRRDTSSSRSPPRPPCSLDPIWRNNSPALLPSLLTLLSPSPCPVGLSSPPRPCASPDHLLHTLSCCTSFGLGDSSQSQPLIIGPYKPYHPNLRGAAFHLIRLLIANLANFMTTRGEVRAIRARLSRIESPTSCDCPY